jgi:hypothetical protein
MAVKDGRTPASRPEVVHENLGSPELLQRSTKMIQKPFLAWRLHGTFESETIVPFMKRP